MNMTDRPKKRLKLMMCTDSCYLRDFLVKHIRAIEMSGKIESSVSGLVLIVLCLFTVYQPMLIRAQSSEQETFAPQSTPEDSVIESVGGWDGRDGRYIWSERLEWQVITDSSKPKKSVNLLLQRKCYLSWKVLTFRIVSINFFLHLFISLQLLGYIMFSPRTRRCI